MALGIPEVIQRQVQWEMHIYKPNPLHSKHVVLLIDTQLSLNDGAFTIQIVARYSFIHQTPILTLKKNIVILIGEGNGCFPNR